MKIAEGENMKIGTKLVAAVLGTAFSMTVLAQGTPQMEKRDANQQKRIEQGVKSGELTRREAARLKAGERKIDRMETRAAADGTVTAKEKARINRAQNAESRAIHRQKHDAQKR